MSKKIGIILLISLLVILVVPAAALAAEHNVPADGDLATVVAAAADGDTIILAAGTHTLTSQLVIDKGLFINGAGQDLTTISIGFNTGGSGDARGAILVTSTGALILQDVTLDGAGQDVYHGIRVNGGLLGVGDSTISNIVYPGYKGAGLVYFNAAQGQVAQVTMTNMGREGIMSFGAGTYVEIIDLTYIGKGDGDWLDYGIEIGGGGTADITGANISNCTGVALSDGSGSGGILATTYFGPGTAAVITNSVFTNNTVDVFVGYDDTDTSVVEIHGSTLSLGQKVVVTGTGQTVDASGNYWGTNDMDAVIADLGNVNIDVDPIVEVANPRTGDSSFKYTWIAVILTLLVAGCAAFVMSRRKAVQ